MKPLDPVAWLTDFQDALKSVKCRIGGKDADLKEGLDALMAFLSRAKDDDSTVWWVGNGGSAAICSHLSHDLVNKLGVRSALLSDPALLTCMANDYGYPQVYSRPLGIMARPGDRLIAISSAGKSENILAGARLAVEKKLKLATFSGFDEKNPLRNVPAALSFYVPSSLYGHVELGHEGLLHAAIEALWMKGKNS